MMKIDLSKYDNPEIVNKDDKLQVYDKLKGIYRVVSPNQHSEEYVRQKIIEYLNKELNITYAAMDIEESEAHYHDNNQRMDLLISGESDKKELLMVVECKAETVDLTEDVYDQAKGYAERLNIPVIMVTNGLEADFLKKDENNNYTRLVNAPTYDELLDYANIKTEPIPEYSYNRYSLEELFNEKIQEKEMNKDYDDKTKAIHFQTRDELKPYILNFRDCLLDTSHKIDDLSLGKYNFIKDLGVFYRKVDNTGGKFVGYYRSLRVEIDGNYEIINLKVTPYATDSGRTDTVMMIALNGAEIQWIRFDRFGVLEDNTLKFYDDGATSTRNMGPMKRSIILDYIEENSDLEINDENMIQLGQIDMTNLLYADNPEFKNLIGNCIEYALLKQERRSKYQENYVPKNKDDENLPEGINKKHIQKILKELNLKELDDDAMEYLIDYLNLLIINISKDAIKEAEKSHHRNISQFDMLRVLNRNEQEIDEVEKVTIFGETYNSILDYMLNCSFYIPVSGVFDEEHASIASKYDFEGKYTFEIEDSSSNKKYYNFVCRDIFEENNEELLELIPIELPDSDLFQIFDDKLNGSYIPYYEEYTPDNFQTNENELVDYFGNVRQIEYGETYVTENGINYLVNEEDDNLIVPKEYLEDIDILKDMEKDDYYGVYLEEYIYNTGEHVFEEYYIEDIDDENIYLEKDDEIPRNRYRIPSYLEFDEDDGKSYIIVKRFLGAEYINSDELMED